MTTVSLRPRPVTPSAAPRPAAPSFPAGPAVPLDRFERPLADGPRRVGEASPAPRADSRYWRGGEERTVTIDGHDFDFLPKENKTGERVKGEVDGPLSHNGSYEVLENDAARDRFQMKMNAGNDRAQKNDLDVTITIAGGRATVTGKVKGKELGEGVGAPVEGRGTSGDPYRLKFRDGEGKEHSIEWTR